MEDREAIEPKSGGGGFPMLFLFLILVAAAFFAGMAIRYQKDTGGSLIDAIKAKGQVKKTPAATAPVPPK